MSKFEHFKLSPQWRQYFNQYPGGYTIAENLIDWISRVNKMVDNQNDLNSMVGGFRNELDSFIKQFDTQLQGEVEKTLSEWQDSGFLDVVIDEALQTQVSEVAKQVNDIEINAKYPPIGLNGVKFDGATDETETLNNLLDYLDSRGGGTLKLPEGTGVISSTIIQPPNTFIRGRGKNLTKIVWDMSDLTVHEDSVMLKAIFESGLDNGGISELTLDQKRVERGLKDEQTYGAIQAKRNYTIDSVRIMNTIGPGVSQSGVENIVIINSDIVETGHHPIYFSTGSLGFVKNILIENCNLGTPSYIPLRNHGANIFKIRHSNPGDVVENVVFRDNRVGTSVDDQIINFSTTPGGDLCVIKNIKITDNTINVGREVGQGTRTGIYMGASSHIEFVLIDRNTMFSDSTDYGIRILKTNLEDEKTITIKNNVVEGFDNSIESKESIIVNNTLTPTNFGIVGSHNSRVIDNHFYSNMGGVVGLFRNRNVDILNNTFNFSGANTKAVELGESDSNLIMNNVVIRATIGFHKQVGATLLNCTISNIFIDCDERYRDIDIVVVNRDNIVEPNLKDRHGSTSNRPNPLYVGERFFDTTLNKPIWWNGENWVDSEGQIV